jgi:hypothetical protein
VFLDLLAGGGLVAAGYLAGYLTARAIRQRSAGQEDCTCGHPVSAHDQSGCTDQARRESKWDDIGVPIGWQYVPCPCVRYVAPGVSYVPEIDGPPRGGRASNSGLEGPVQ